MCAHACIAIFTVHHAGVIMNVDLIIAALQESRRLDNTAQKMRREIAHAVCELPTLDRKRIAEAVGMDARSLELLASMAVESVPDGTVMRSKWEETCPGA